MDMDKFRIKENPYICIEFGDQIVVIIFKSIKHF